MNTKTVSDILTTYQVEGDEPTELLEETLELAAQQVDWLRGSNWGDVAQAAADQLLALQTKIERILQQRQGFGLDGMTPTKP